jgi:hypothetical protein
MLLTWDFAIAMFIVILSGCSSGCSCIRVSFRPAVGPSSGPSPMAGAAPQGFLHAVGGVLGEFQADVGVALGLAELRVPEDLLHNADVDALLKQERARRVPSVMHACLPDSGCGEEVVPGHAKVGWARLSPVDGHIAVITI